MILHTYWLAAFDLTVFCVRSSDELGLCYFVQRENLIDFIFGEICRYSITVELEYSYPSGFITGNMNQS